MIAHIFTNYIRSGFCTKIKHFRTFLTTGKKENQVMLQPTSSYFRFFDSSITGNQARAVCYNTRSKTVHFK